MEIPREEIMPLQRKPTSDTLLNLQQHILFVFSKRLSKEKHAGLILIHLNS